MTVGLGAGQYEYRESGGGCTTFPKRGTEVVGFAQVDHITRKRLAVSADVTLAPLVIAEGERGGRESPPFGVFGVAARIGLDRRFGAFAIGPALVVHPELEPAAPIPSLTTRIGPRRFHVWGRVGTSPTPGITPTLFQAGFGAQGPNGSVQLGILPPSDRIPGGVLRVSARAADRLQVGGELVLHEVYGDFPGPDARFVGMVTYRLPDATR